MPSQAPTYLHWSQDMPCTTNQVYGYHERAAAEKEERQPSKKLRGPFDYTQPFSNTGFVPWITADTLEAARNRQTNTTAVDPLRSLDTNSPGCAITYDINRGFTMGYVPVTEKMQSGQAPPGLRLARTVSVPPAYRYPTPKAKNVYLWHARSGCLVHIKNHVPEPRVDPYAVGS